jgi:hypothetical protein
MAKRIGSGNSDEPVVAKPKKRVRYYARYARYSFDYPAVNDDGTVKVKRNAQGQEMYDADGAAIPIHKHAIFVVDQSKMSKGFLSHFDFDPNDTSEQNKVLGVALQKLADDTSLPAVMTEDSYDATTNAPMYVEKKRAAELEAKVEMLEQKLNTPEELEKRLEELTRG